MLNPLGFRPLSAVFGSSIFSAFDPDRVEGAADNVVPHSGQIFDSAAPNQHDRVLLKIVTNSRNIGRDLDAVGQSDARDLAQS